jgi:integration host factor subunit beta
MNRSEFIAALAADHPHLRHADVELIVLTVFGQIIDAQARGQRVELRNFGTFSIKQRKAFARRNPRTGAEVPVTAMAVPYFRAAGDLLGRLNGNPVLTRRHEPG